MPGQGRAVERPYTAEERRAGRVRSHSRSLTPPRGLDIHLNDRAYWRNVPSAVWHYKLGGYQVLKKWLSYRERGVLGRPLRPEEVQHFTDTALAHRGDTGAGEAEGCKFNAYRVSWDWIAGVVYCFAIYGSAFKNIKKLRRHRRRGERYLPRPGQTCPQAVLSHAGALRMDSHPAAGLAGERLARAAERQGACRLRTLRARSGSRHGVAAAGDMQRSPSPSTTDGGIWPETTSQRASWGHSGRGKCHAETWARVVEPRHRDGEGMDGVRTSADEPLRYLNDRVYWRNVPSAVWQLQAGRVPGRKKWLSYRERGVLKVLRPEWY